MRLTDQQIEEIRNHLGELETEFRVILEKHFIELSKGGARMVSSMEPSPIPGDTKKAFYWLHSPSYTATRLCGLTEKQLELILPVVVDEESWRGRIRAPFGPVFTRDFGTDESYSFLDERFAGNRVPLNRVGSIFHLSMYQVDRMLEADEGDLLKQAEALSQVQLRSLFLYDPFALREISNFLK